MKTLLKFNSVCAALALMIPSAKAIEVLHIGNVDSVDYSSFITAEYPDSNWVHIPSGLTAANTVGGDLDRITDFDIVGIHGGTGITVKSYLESFDLIIAEQVFEHLKWPYRAAKNVYRMLRPGGSFLITTPFLVRCHEMPDDCTRWTDTELKNFLN